MCMCALLGCSTFVSKGGLRIVRILGLIGSTLFEELHYVKENCRGFFEGLHEKTRHI